MIQAREPDPVIDGWRHIHLTVYSTGEQAVMCEAYQRIDLAGNADFARVYYPKYYEYEPRYWQNEAGKYVGRVKVTALMNFRST